jgi:uncharacterized protein (UPF0212 family)
MITLTGKVCPNCNKKNVNWVKINQGKVYCNECQWFNAPIDWFSVIVGLLTIVIFCLLLWYLPSILVSIL